MADSRRPVKYIPPAPSTVSRFNARLVKLQQIKKNAAFLPAQSMTTEEYVAKLPGLRLFTASALASSTESSLFANTDFQLRKNELIVKAHEEKSIESIIPTYMFTRGRP